MVRRDTIGSMKSIVVANWKMNPASFKEAKKLFEATKKAAEKSPNVSLIVAPPAIFLRELAGGYRGKKLSFVVQNAHAEAKGAFTGEISIAQAHDAGASYVLVGHSERRAAGETNDDTRKKTSAAISARMTPILCIGEEKRAALGEHFSFVRDQLRAGFADVPPARVSRVIVAYEPVWAIGSETTMKPRDMHEMAIFIRKTIIDMYGEVGHAVRILYGAAVTDENAPAMMREGDVRGLLVGHVSTNAERFAALINSISKA